jgi:hypothetical protein
MDNVGSSAWEVSSADEEYVETSGGENPTITLETGVRYTISNEGWSDHPLAFRDESGSTLLSQSSEGEFENDGDVNWSDDGDKLAFTLTDGLAAEVDRYICTVHNVMEGDVGTDTNVPSELDSQAVTAIVEEAGVSSYQDLDGLAILDSYTTYLSNNGTVGGTQLGSSLPILDVYTYYLENPSEFN